MIPPSIALVVYGLLTEASIGKLFIAGIVPGLITAIGYIATISLTLWRHPEYAPRMQDMLVDATGGQLEKKGRVWPIGLLVLLVLGSLRSAEHTSELTYLMRN